MTFLREVVVTGARYPRAYYESPQALSFVSRAQLEDRLYGWGEELESNAISVYMHQLRKKLGAGLILNVRGVGYMVPKP